MNEKINVLIDQETVEKRVQELADELNRVYAGETVRLLCILKGSLFFTCELAKRLTVPVTIDFMQVSSYGNGTMSSGTVTIRKDTDASIENENVIVVEDIVDTGRTLNELLRILRKRKPKSLKLCSLLDKPSRRAVDVKADYVGFEIPDVFVVGYGLDYAQYYRNLPFVGVIEELGGES